MPLPFAPGPMLPLRGAGLGAPPGADMAIGSDTTVGMVQAFANGFRRSVVVLDREMQEREIMEKARIDMLEVRGSAKPSLI